MKVKSPNTLKRVSSKTELIILALLTSKNYAEASKKAGISEASLYRLLKNDKFIQEFYESKKKVMDVALIKLQANCNEAVTTLIDVMKNENTPPSVKVMSARTILEMTLKLTENEEIIKKIAEIENAMIINV